MARKKTTTSKSEATDMPDVNDNTPDNEAESTGSAQKTDAADDVASPETTSEDTLNELEPISETDSGESNKAPDEQDTTPDPASDDKDYSERTDPLDQEVETDTSEVNDEDISTGPEETVAENSTDTKVENSSETARTDDAGTEVEELKAEDDAAIEDTGAKPTEAVSVAQPPEETKPQSSNPVSLIFGGVLAGAIGFAAAYFGLAQQTDPTVENLATDVASLRDELSTLVASAPAEPDFTPILEQIDDMSSRIADVDGRFETTQSLIDEVNARLDGIESAAVASTLPEGAQDAFAAELEAARTAIAEERAALADMIAQAQTSEEEANKAAQAAMQRAALGEILTALDTGAIFEGPLNELAMNGAEIPKDLTDAGATGVVPLAALQESFPAVARDALAAARATEEGTSGFSGFLRAQLGARSLAPRDGGDPDAILSRAEAALGDANLADALAEIETLPPEAVSALASWIDDASTRLNTVLAVQSLSDGLN